MTNTTYNASNLVARNGAEYSEATDAIVARHQAEIDAFLQDNPTALREFDGDRAVASYGAEYFHEAGGSDEDGEYSIRATIEAHDLTTDDLDHIESHGIYAMGDIRAYQDIGCGDQSDRKRDLALMDTRAETTAELRAHRREQLARHLTGERQTRGERIVEGKQTEAERRRIIRERAAAKRAKRAKRHAASKA